MKDLTDKTIIETCHGIFEDMEHKGHKPKLDIADKQVVNPLKDYPKEKDCQWQFVEPSNHRSDATERAIQTFKHRIISGTCSINSKWPL